MRNKKIAQVLADIERIDFMLEGKPYVALYNESNCSESEALRAIREMNFDYPKIATLTKEQYENLFPIAEVLANGKRK